MTSGFSYETEERVPGPRGTETLMPTSFDGPGRAASNAGHAAARCRHCRQRGGAVADPVACLFALSGTGEDWPHLVANVLPGAARTTLLLLAMVAAMHRDRRRRRGLAGRRVRFPAAAHAAVGAGAAAGGAALSGGLCVRRVLPLFTGPVQSLVRALFGFETHPRLLVSRHPLDPAARPSCCPRCSTLMSI